MIELANNVGWHGLGNLVIRRKGLANANRTCRWQTTPFLGACSIFLQMYDTRLRESSQVVQYPSIGNVQDLHNFRNRLPASKDFEDAPTQWIGEYVRTIIFDNEHCVL